MRPGEARWSSTLTQLNREGGRGSRREAPESPFESRRQKKLRRDKRNGCLRATECACHGLSIFVVAQSQLALSPLPSKGGLQPGGSRHAHGNLSSLPWWPNLFPHGLDITLFFSLSLSRQVGPAIELCWRLESGSCAAARPCLLPSADHCF